MQRYMIKDNQNRILSVFRTNAVPPKGSVAITDDMEIDSELYAGDEPRLESEDNKMVVEIYPAQPDESYEWDKDTKEWKKRPEPVDEIAELKRRIEILENKK